MSGEALSVQTLKIEITLHFFPIMKHFLLTLFSLRGKKDKKGP